MTTNSSSTDEASRIATVVGVKESLVTIDTGVAKFKVDTNLFRLFDSVTVGAQELVSGHAICGAVLEEESGLQHRVETKATQVKIEEQGEAVQIDLVFDEGYRRQVAVQFTH